jgi:hypothetical protein
MLKWILIVLGVLIVAVMGTCYWGYRQVTGGGNSATVTVAGSADQIWSYLTDLDSMAVIADSTMSVSSTGDGVLAVGDTLRFRERGGRSLQSGVMEWKVVSLDAPRVRVLSTGIDTAQKAALERIDSVLVVGDSVRIVSTLRARGVERIAASDSVGAVGGVVMGGATKLMIGGMRMMAELELERLKAHVDQP